MDTIRIAMWSGPRNISTAMMRSWGARSDCAVTDEPFYAAYLAATGIAHPMRGEVIASQPTDWDAVARACATDARAPVVYQKHMSQHMVPGAPLEWMAGLRHAFLIRPPAEVAASFAVKMDRVTAEDLGFRRQAELFAIAGEMARDNAAGSRGAVPPVIEARDVLENPEGMLKALCAALDVPFDAGMLRWPAGRHPDDGVWGAHWYGAVAQSTGFAAPREPQEPPAHLGEVIAACQPHYETMAARKLKAI